MEILFLKGNSGHSLLGLGAKAKFRMEDEDVSALDDFLASHKGEWIFTALSYDLKENLHGLASHNRDRIEFPKALLVIPETVLRISGWESEVVAGTLTPEQEAIVAKLVNDLEQDSALERELIPTTSKTNYISQVNKLKDQLQYGSIYEVNYCQEYYLDNALIENEVAFFHRLESLTDTPFSAYWRVDEFSVFCASPERFLERKGNILRSQPIKGTIKRGQSHEEDEALKEELLNNPKERAENVMIVDLVRNDLSQLATKGSVKVDELFGIYSFQTVHQMISTISCTQRDGLRFSEILKATFPMGSMTGAPKISAMKHIEEHEDFKRGLYSGSLGYIAPNGDFDLNVVIRSIICNREKKTINCPVGSAITIRSEAEAEYEECRVKIHSFLGRLSLLEQK